MRIASGCCKLLISLFSNLKISLNKTANSAIKSKISNAKFTRLSPITTGKKLTLAPPKYQDLQLFLHLEVNKYIIDMLSCK